jgi:hypothetical protein
MKLKDLYILNSALDGQDIYSLPTNDSRNLSALSREVVKETMVEKGILQDHSTLTEQGLRLVDRLRRFKQTRRHLSIGDVTLGILENGVAVALIHDTYHDEYDLRIVDASDLYGQVVDSCGFLEYEAGDAVTEVVEMDEESFEKNYELNAHNALRLRAESLGFPTSDEVYFLADDGFHIYDYANHILIGTDKTELLRTLKERLETDG